MIQSDSVDSGTPFRRSMLEVGRNDLCPCGSGKKFKQCCGKTTLHQNASIHPPLVRACMIIASHSIRETFRIDQEFLCVW